MSEFRSILLPVDLSPHARALTPGSRLAADQALRLAKECGSAVTILHSTAADEFWSADEGDFSVRAQGLAEPGHRVLEGLCEEFRAAGLKAELSLSEERADLAILHSVLRERPDLVVTGKRNEAEAGGHRIGSVAIKLLRNSPCPVWVAKPGGSATPRRILAASDLSPVGQRVIAISALLARCFGSVLHVVHSFQIPFDVQWEPEEGERDFERRTRDEHRAQLEQQVAAAGFDGEVHYHVGLTSPSRAILACEERLDPDLVVMGTVSRGGIAGLLVGNTAERLLARLDTSLLTVKPDDFVCPIRDD